MTKQRQSSRSIRRSPSERHPSVRSASAPDHLDTLSAAQAAVLLHVHVKSVQSMARSGRLPAVRVGRKWLFQRDAIGRLLGARREPSPARHELEISARNKLRGTVTSLEVDGLMAELHLDIGGQEIVSVITRSSAERLGLRVGVEAFALIKATEVLVGREERRS